MGISGDVQRYNTADDDNFSQVGLFWNNVLSAAEQTRLVENIAGHMKDAQEFIQKRAVNNFAQADPEFGRRLRELLAQYKGQASASGGVAANL